MSTPPPASGDATRRQLGFSLFLQGFAALMLSVALIVRVTALGFDLVAGLFVIGLIVVAGAVGYTLRRLRAG